MKKYNAESITGVQKIILLTVVFIVFTFSAACSQALPDSLLNRLDPDQYAASVSKSTDQLQKKLVRKSLRTLAKMQKQEEKTYRKLLTSKDSVAARKNLPAIKARYASLRSNIKSPDITRKAKQYIPSLDSLNTSLKFLNENRSSEKIKQALAKTELLKDKFQQAEEIKNFIKERREQLKQQLEKAGMLKQLKKLNKEIYYYAAQVKEYKETLKDPKKIEKKALALLAKTKLFQNFMRRNSMLASLFRMPGNPDNPGSAANLAGLQTRAQVNNLIQQQISSGGPNGPAQFRQNLQDAQAQLNQLKNKVLKGGGSSSNDEMPEGFKPNNQKTKSFLQRLELGTNMQTEKASNYFPVTSDLGLSLGYKLNDKSVIGIGASYKMGLGRGWEHINITHQGVGLRSYVDIKLKGSFWLSGGYEQNYRTAFNDIDQLKDQSAWQQSGLLGISKTIAVKSKLFKKTSIKLLWDFMSYQQVPRTQPVVFRVGYSFK